MWCGPWRLRGKPASPPIRAGAAVSSAVAGQPIELHGVGNEVEAEGLSAFGVSGEGTALVQSPPGLPRHHGVAFPCWGLG